MKTKERGSEVSEVRLFFQDNEYIAKLNDGVFKIGSPYPGTYKGDVGTYNPSTGKILWRIVHCCGSQGFGQGEDDKCDACEKPIRGTDNEEDKRIARFSGNYSPEFESFIKTELGRYLEVGRKERELEAIAL